MPQTAKPVCLKCGKEESPMWSKVEKGVVCADCSSSTSSASSSASEKPPKAEPEESIAESKEPSSNSSDSKEAPSAPKTRKSTRSTRYKTRLNPFALPKPLAPKGKGRRVIFKKVPMKAPTAVATPVTSNYVFFKGSYIQVGDIVSMLDTEGDIYYAQIRGLLTDQYCEKSAVITWLLPTQDSPPPQKMFDPATYVIGPEEEIPRKLECMEFVMHAPSDYFKAKNTPYPIVYPPPTPGFIWTSLRPVPAPVFSD